MNISKIVFAILLTGPSSPVNANDNISVIEQVGGELWRMQAGVTQTGNNTSNTSTVKQDGAAKDAFINQGGDNNNNASSVTQLLIPGTYGSTVFASQGGSDNNNNSIVMVIDEGFSDVRQIGDATVNNSIINQNSHGFEAGVATYVSQGGERTSNDLSVTQSGDGAVIDIDQTGNDATNTSTVDQSGYAAFVTVRQGGDNNSNDSRISELGVGEVIIDQLGTRNTNRANISLSGFAFFDTNKVRLTQQGTDNDNTAEILGNETDVEVTQQGSDDRNVSFVDASGGATVNVLQGGNNQSNTSSVKTTGGAISITQQ